MKGYRLNPNKDFVARIIEGVYRKNGHCPCRRDETEETLCPCDEFINTGVCRCGLFVRIEEKQEKKEENKKTE